MHICVINKLSLVFPLFRWHFPDLQSRFSQGSKVMIDSWTRSAGYGGVSNNFHSLSQNEAALQAPCIQWPVGSVTVQRDILFAPYLTGPGALQTPYIYLITQIIICDTESNYCGVLPHTP